VNLSADPCGGDEEPDICFVEKWTRWRVLAVSIRDRSREGPTEQVARCFGVGAVLIDGWHFGVVLEPVQHACQQKVAPGGEQQLAEFVADASAGAAQGLRELVDLVVRQTERGDGTALPGAHGGDVHIQRARQAKPCQVGGAPGCLEHGAADDPRRRSRP
jgi:hypothetical protein